MARRWSVLSPRLVAGLALAVVPAVRAGVVTNASDAERTGWYPNQQSLTPQLVTSPSFAQRFSVPIDGQVYAQPLVANNTLFIATETNWIYRLDPETGQIMWKRQVGAPWNPADLGCGDLTPWVGITGTPVIDDSTNTAFFFSKTYASGTTGPAAYYAHGVDIITGKERPGFPVLIQGTAQNNPSQSFNATHHMNRPGLLLMNGVVYAGFGSHCDIGPWQGWIVGVTTSGQIKTMWVDRSGTDKSGAAIWQSGGGVVSDGPGRIFFATGNGGAAPPGPGSSPPADCGECVMHLDVQPDGSLRADDFFAPYTSALLDAADGDLGSGAVVSLPSQYFGTPTYPHTAVVDGKNGYVYLLNRDHLGGMAQAPTGKDDVIQRIGQYGGVWSRPSVWPGDGGHIMVPTNGGPFRYFRYSVDVPTDKPQLALEASSSDSFGFGSGSPVVTSSGTTSGSGLVWIIYMPDGSGANAELRAYDPVPSGSSLVERFSAPVGTGSKFAPPGVGYGRVYVGARDGHVVMFGPTVIGLTVTRDPSLGNVQLTWSGGNAPYTLIRARDADFKVSPTTLVDHQPATSFIDPVLGDGQTYFYLVR